ncbi:MAG: ABC transporter permease, partial [Sedimenticolaceae bacterium]
MGSIAESTQQALGLLFGGDPGLWEIVGISFQVSLTAIAIATPVALALAFLLAFGRFPGRRVLITVFNTFLSFPAVVVGLTFYLLLSRQGPLGEWQLLFTQPAMIIGQIVLALPILVAMGHSSLQAV